MLRTFELSYGAPRIRSRATGATLSSLGARLGASVTVSTENYGQMGTLASGEKPGSARRLIGENAIWQADFAGGSCDGGSARVSHFGATAESGLVFAGTPL